MSIWDNTFISPNRSDSHTDLTIKFEDIVTPDPLFDLRTAELELYEKVRTNTLVDLADDLDGVTQTSNTSQHFSLSQTGENSREEYLRHFLKALHSSEDEAPSPMDLLRAIPQQKTQHMITSADRYLLNRGRHQSTPNIDMKNRSLTVLDRRRPVWITSFCELTDFDSQSSTKETTQQKEQGSGKAFIAVGSADGHITFYQLPSLRPLGQLRNLTSLPMAMCVIPVTHSRYTKYQILSGNARSQAQQQAGTPKSSQEQPGVKPDTQLLSNYLLCVGESDGTLEIFALSSDSIHRTTDLAIKRQEASLLSLFGKKAGLRRDMRKKETKKGDWLIGNDLSTLGRSVLLSPALPNTGEDEDAQGIGSQYGQEGHMKYRGLLANQIGDNLVQKRTRLTPLEMLKAHRQHIVIPTREAGTGFTGDLMGREKTTNIKEMGAASHYIDMFSLKLGEIPESVRKREEEQHMSELLNERRKDKTLQTRIRSISTGRVKEPSLERVESSRSGFVRLNNGTWKQNGPRVDEEHTMTLRSRSLGRRENPSEKAIDRMINGPEGIHDPFWLPPLYASHPSVSSPIRSQPSISSFIPSSPSHSPRPRPLRSRHSRHQRSNSSAWTSTSQQLPTPSKTSTVAFPPPKSDRALNFSPILSDDQSSVCLSETDTVFEQDSTNQDSVSTTQFLQVIQERNAEALALQMTRREQDDVTFRRNEGSWQVKHHIEAISSIRYVQETDTLITGSHDCTVRFWSINEYITEIGCLGTAISLKDQIAQERRKRDADLDSSSVDRSVSPLLSSSPPAQTMFANGAGHTQSVTAIVYSHPFHMLITASLDNTVCFWNPNTLRELARLKGHTQPVIDLCIDEDNSWLLSLSLDKTIRIWDLKTQSCLQTLDAYDHATQSVISKIAFVSKPKSETSLFSDSYVLVGGKRMLKWKPVSMMDVNEECHLHPLIAVLYSKTFDNIITVDESRIVNVWQASDSQLLSRYTLPHIEPISTACLDAAGRRLITGSLDGMIFISHFNTGTVTGEVHPIPFKSEVYSIVHAKPYRTVNGLILHVGADRRLYSYEDQKKPIGYRFDSKILPSIGYKEPAEIIAEQRNPKQKFVLRGPSFTIKENNARNRKNRGKNSVLVNKVSEYDQIDPLAHLIDPNDTRLNLVAKEQPPAIKLFHGPTHTRHRGEITKITYEPPSIITTASDDGTVVAWNSDSGFAKCTFQVQPVKEDESEERRSSKTGRTEKEKNTKSDNVDTLGTTISTLMHIPSAKHPHTLLVITKAGILSFYSSLTGQCFASFRLPFQGDFFCCVELQSDLMMQDRGLPDSHSKQKVKETVTDTTESQIYLLAVATSKGDVFIFNLNELMDSREVLQSLMKDSETMSVSSEYGSFGRPRNGVQRMQSFDVGKVGELGNDDRDGYANGNVSDPDVAFPNVIASRHDTEYSTHNPVLHASFTYKVDQSGAHSSYANPSSRNPTPPQVPLQNKHSRRTTPMHNQMVSPNSQLVPAPTKSPINPALSATHDRQLMKQPSTVIHHPTVHDLSDSLNDLYTMNPNQPLPSAPFTKLCWSGLLDFEAMFLDYEPLNPSSPNRMNKKLSKQDVEILQGRETVKTRLTLVAFGGTEVKHNRFDPQETEVSSISFIPSITQLVKLPKMNFVNTTSDAPFTPTPPVSPQNRRPAPRSPRSQQSRRSPSEQDTRECSVSAPPFVLLSFGRYAALFTLDGALIGSYGVPLFYSQPPINLTNVHLTQSYIEHMLQHQPLTKITTAGTTTDTMTNESLGIPLLFSPFYEVFDGLLPLLMPSPKVLAVESMTKERKRIRRRKLENSDFTGNPAGPLGHQDGKDTQYDSFSASPVDSIPNPSPWPSTLPLTSSVHLQKRTPLLSVASD
ncbi:putative Macrophage mannose receptor 1 [Blattamonas nauphoetae]|uniref:Macrophage mannose receptor 1 n=1 Tax=Blattamonas nauphoetae TaxID=2049346 RepID=A0ABQ9XN82_9EUKA|nr:putative Macrophage mannose receptor 1 [Blattamonas nauphoetae]